MRKKITNYHFIKRKRRNFMKKKNKFVSILATLGKLCVIGLAVFLIV